jgi:hypothetical protein
MITNVNYKRTKTKIRSQEIIKAIYQHLKAAPGHSATTGELIKLTGCSLQTVGGASVQHFNEHLRELEIDWRFTTSKPSSRGPVVWTLKQKSVPAIRTYSSSDHNF